MAVENMGFGSFTQDIFMGYGFASGNQDGFCFTELPHNLASASSSSSFSCGSLPLDMVQSVYCELERQRMEMDWFLKIENQRLRSSILLEGTRHRAIIMQKYESYLKILMLQKDEQLAVAKYRSKELQNSLQVSEMEARAWKKKAKEKEADVCYLRNRLNAAQQQNEMVSFCDSSSEHKKTEEPMKDIACKVCRTRSKCFVFFPCRHFCCCDYCEPLLGRCPICGTVKETGLEVLLG